MLVLLKPPWLVNEILVRVYCTFNVVHIVILTRYGYVIVKQISLLIMCHIIIPKYFTVTAFLCVA
jgi:hypothetical protein